MTASCKESCTGGAHSRWSANIQTLVPFSMKGSGRRKKNTPVQKYPPATSRQRGPPDFPGPSATFSSAPTVPWGARGLPTRGPSAPESPGPCHTAHTGHCFSRTQPAATTATWLLGLSVPANRSFPFRSNLPKQPLRLNWAQAGGPRTPEPPPSIPAQLGEGLEIQLLDFLLAQPVANSLPFQKGLHLPFRAGSWGPEEIAHRPSLAARRAPRACGHLLPAAGTRNGATGAQSCREGRAGAGRAPRRRERRSARHSTGCRRVGAARAAAAHAPAASRAPGAQVRERQAGPGRRGGRPSLAGAAQPTALPALETEKHALQRRPRRIAPALWLRTAPEFLLLSLPLALARGPRSESPAARSADPTRAHALPGALGPRRGARGRPLPPPSRPHPPLPPLPPRPRPRPSPQPAGAAVLTRPGGPLDPAGAEEERPRRPLGGSTARRLLKAPRLPPSSPLVRVCVEALAVELGD